MSIRLTRPLLRQFPSRASPSLLHRNTHTPTHLPPNFSPTVTDKTTALESLSSLLQSPDQSNGNSSSSSSASSDESPSGTAASGGKWTLTPPRTGLQRTYKFKTFKDAWGFMSVVAERCKKERHHPEWFNCYNEVKITWTTHRPKGLSEKDILMARFCDEKAGEMGGG